MRKIVILGAGISGLATAWFLQQKYKDVAITLVERSSRVGGWIRTIEQDGFLFELGPRSLRTRGTGANALELIKSLGLESELILPDAAAQKRFVLHNKTLLKAPSGIIELFTSPLTRGIIPQFMKEFTVPKGNDSDESIDSFFRRRLGDQAADLLINPLVAGIFAGNPTTLSMRSCFPPLFEMERKYGSITKGMLRSLFKPRQKGPRIVSLKNGMESLIHALKDHVKADIIFNSTAQKLQWNPSGISLSLSNGTNLEADHVFSTLPVYEIAPLCGFQWDLKYASVGVVNLGYRKNVLKQNGFGYLIPSKENENILGVVFDSCVFPQHNRHQGETRLTVMIRDRQPQTSDKLKEMALEAIERHLGIKHNPDTILASLAQQSIPQYPLDYKDRHLPSLPHLTLIGTGFHGVSVGDCISSANSATKREVFHGSVERLLPLGNL